MSMRVIAGEFRGRKLMGPKDASTTRPITDRVKTSLFDRLCHSLKVLEPGGGGVVLDIFSGTGTLGIEALSRGAERCVFVDQDRDAIRRLQQNLDTLGISDRAEILRTSALMPGWVQQLPAKDRPVRVAMVDPPYAMLRDADGWATLMPLFESLAEVVEPGGVMMVRVEKTMDHPPIAGWNEPLVYSYGSMKLGFYVK